MNLACRASPHDEKPVHSLSRLSITFNLLYFSATCVSLQFNMPVTSCLFTETDFRNTQNPLSAVLTL